MNLVENETFFHGSKAEFSSFSQKFGRNKRKAFYFHKDRTLAAQYGPNIKAVHLIARKIFDYENREHQQILQGLLKQDPRFEDWMAKEAQEGDWEVLEKKDVQAYLRKNGFDGYYVNDHPGKALAVFHPSQIILIDQKGEHMTENNNNQAQMKWPDLSKFGAKLAIEIKEDDSRHLFLQIVDMNNFRAGASSNFFGAMKSFGFDVSGRFFSGRKFFTTRPSLKIAELQTIIPGFKREDVREFAVADVMTREEKAVLNEQPEQKQKHRLDDSSDSMNLGDAFGSEQSKSTNAYDEAHERLDKIRPTMKFGNEASADIANKVIFQVHDAMGEHLEDISAPHDGSSENIGVVATAMRFYASEFVKGASMRQSPMVATDHNCIVTHTITQGEGMAVVEQLHHEESTAKQLEEDDLRGEDEQTKIASVDENGDDLEGFLADLSPMRKAKAAQTLDKTVSDHGRILSRKDFVREKIDAGATVKTKLVNDQDEIDQIQKRINRLESFGAESPLTKENQAIIARLKKKLTESDRRLEMPDGIFWELTSTELDFAEYLIKRREGDKTGTSHAVDVQAAQFASILPTIEFDLQYNRMAKYRPEFQNRIVFDVGDASGQHLKHMAAPHDGTESGIRQVAAAMRFYAPEKIPGAAMIHSGPMIAFDDKAQPIHHIYEHNGDLVIEDASRGETRKVSESTKETEESLAALTSLFPTFKLGSKAKAVNSHVFFDAYDSDGEPIEFIAAPHDGSFENINLVASAMRHYASELLVAGVSNEKSSMYATDERGVTKYITIPGSGNLELLPVKDDDPTSPVLYAKVLRHKFLQLKWQDVLDHFFEHRVVDTRNSLREFGWEGDRNARLAYQFTKQDKQTSYYVDCEYLQVGAGMNVVGVTWKVQFVEGYGDDMKTGTLLTMQDDLTITSPADFASAINTAVSMDIESKTFAANIDQPGDHEDDALLKEEQGDIAAPVSEKMAERFEYKGKKAEATVWGRELPGRGWISTFDYQHHQGSHASHLNPLTDQEVYPSRAVALAAAFNRLSKYNRLVVEDHTSSLVTDAQRREAESIVAWSTQHIKDLEKGPDLGQQKREIETVADATSPELYPLILADESLQLRWQDVLDTFFQGRLVDIRNGLRDIEWEDDQSRFRLIKQADQASYRVYCDYQQVGAGNNIVGITWIVTMEEGDGDNARREVLLALRDDLSRTHAQVVETISQVVDTNIKARKAVATQKGEAEKNVTLLLQKLETKGVIPVGNDFHIRIQLSETAFFDLKTQTDPEIGRKLFLIDTSFLSRYKGFAECELVFTAKGGVNLASSTVRRLVGDQNVEEQEVKDAYFAAAYTRNLLKQNIQNGMVLEVNHSSGTYDDLREVYKGKQRDFEKPKVNIIRPYGDQFGQPEKNVASLLEKLGLQAKIMQGEDFYVRVRNSGYLDLVVERHQVMDGSELYLTHYIEDGGDLIMDSEMVFAVSRDGKLRLTDIGGRGPKGPFRGGPDRTFATIFSRNLNRQGFGDGELIYKDQTADESTEVDDVASGSDNDTVDMGIKAWSTANQNPKVLPAMDQVGLPAKNIASLLEKLGMHEKIMQAAGKEFHARVKNGEYLDLVIECHPVSNGFSELFFTHYLGQNGDLGARSEMIFVLSPDGGLSLVETVASGPQGPHRAQDQKFAEIFSQNLINQGYGEGTLVFDDELVSNSLTEEQGGIGMEEEIAQVAQDVPVEIKQGTESSPEQEKSKNGLFKLKRKRDGKNEEKKLPDDAEKIVDVGEKIGGARKDLAGRRIVVSDLDYMNEIEKQELVTKDKIFPPLKYKEMRDAGVDPAVALILKKLRDKLPVNAFKRQIQTKWAIRSLGTGANSRVLSSKLEYAPESYVKALDRIYQAVVDVKTVDELKKAMDSLDRQCRAYYPHDMPEDVSMNSPEIKAYIEAEEFRSSIFKAAHVIRGCDHYIRSACHFVEKHGWDYLIKERGSVQKSESTDVIPERPHLASIQRSGTEFRNGRDIPANELMTHFGARAIEFGNWLPQDERQSVINYAFDALSDLASVLKIKPADIGLEGLGLAFGARGHGGKRAAMAHYEPGRTVVNLTRISGAGSLAHEFGHALDHFLGRKIGAMGYMSENPITYDERFSALVGKFLKLESAIKESPASVRNELFIANENLEKYTRWAKSWISSLRLNKITDSEKIKTFEDGAKRIVDQLKEGTLPFHPAFSTSHEMAVHAHAHVETLFDQMFDRKVSMPKKADQAFYANLRAVERSRTSILVCSEKDIDDIIETKKVKSNYLHQAEKLDAKRSKPYWAKRVELFARAFESWVADTLEKSGMRSDYLVHGVEGDRFGGGAFRGNPYPAGDERERINKAMGEFIQEAARVMAPEETVKKTNGMRMAC